MGTPGYHAYDVAAYIRALRYEGELLADAAGRAGLAAAVPACPGWSVGDLLRHTSYVHRWAAGFVAQRLTSPVPGLSEEAVLQHGPGDESLLGWFCEGHAALVQALEDADPDVDCWAFLSAPSPLAFWARRQAHETAIHRVDTEQAGAAAGRPGGAGAGLAEAGTGDVKPGGGEVGPPFQPAFAADGVDELIMGFLARNIKRPSWPGLCGDLAIHASDGPAARADWLVTGGPGAAAVSRGDGPADCHVTGRAADLYLLLWNRGPAGRLDVTGDRQILAAFGREVHITWS